MTARNTPASTRLRGILIFVIWPVIFSGFACAKRSVATSTHTEISSYSYTAQRGAGVNINTASAKELETLPGIGKGLAERIIEHREKYGPFAKPEHLIMVRGISEHRFQAIRDQITVE
jgi:competence ComEA-like helix-hairpin-helix protein